jgi:hypothetical protein
VIRARGDVAAASWRCERCGTDVRVRRSVVCPLCAAPGPDAPARRVASRGFVELGVVAVAVMALVVAWITVWLHATG